MSALVFSCREPRDRFGLKGPAAAGWLTEHGLAPPAAPNSWVWRGGEPDAAVGPDAAIAPHTAIEPAAAILVARLGTGEFFLEDCAAGGKLRAIEPTAEAHPRGVYPVLREDAAFALSGEGSLEVLAQVCNVNFADLMLDSWPVVMTLMIGVSVLVVPQPTGAQPSSAQPTGAQPTGAQPTGRGTRYLIWCDPTFGHYLGESIGEVVRECGGDYERDSNGGGMA